MSSSLDRMKNRASYTGYNPHDKTIVSGKYKSFLLALSNSYQAEWITLDKGTEKERKYRCLINPSRLTENFDKKVISIDFDSQVQEGTIFWWDRTQKYWMINLQQHTEEAYFRGTITRADYEIDIDGTTYWAIVRGPEETSTEWKEKHQIVWNNLNYTLAIQVAKNSQTIKYFSRHQIVKIKLNYKDVETGEDLFEYHNWRVVATDKYSSNFLIDVYLEEANDNPMEDAQIKPEEKNPNLMVAHIDGPLSVHAFDTNVTYSIVGAEGGRWSVNNNAIKIIKSNSNNCIVDINISKATKFILKYINNDTTIEQEIVVKSF